MTKKTYSVKIDYNQSLAEMIEAGEYDWVNEYITQKRFPVEGEGVHETELVLVHFNKWMSTKEALAGLKEKGLRPANLPELLVFGAKYPKVQREFSIVALGSVWLNPNGNRYVPCLCEDWRGGRGLDLGLCEGDWHEDCWFLAACA